MVPEEEGEEDDDDDDEREEEVVDEGSPEVVATWPPENGAHVPISKRY